MTQPYWVGNQQTEAETTAWNTVILGAVFLPGVCTVTCTTGRDIDVKKEKGKDGAYLTDQGNDPADVKIVVVLPTKADWKIWLQVLPEIHPRRAGGARSPLEILHPEPNTLGIRNITIKSIKGAPPTARGGKTYEIECMEWFPEPKKPKGTGRAKPAKRKPVWQRPITERTQEELWTAPSGVDALDQIFADLDKLPK